jgi:hypothetical protein
VSDSDSEPAVQARRNALRRIRAPRRGGPNDALYDSLGIQLEHDKQEIQRINAEASSTELAFTSATGIYVAPPLTDSNAKTYRNKRMRGRLAVEQRAALGTPDGDRMHPVLKMNNKLPEDMKAIVQGIMKHIHHDSKQEPKVKTDLFHSLGAMFGTGACMQAHSMWWNLLDSLFMLRDEEKDNISQEGLAALDVITEFIRQFLLIQKQQLKNVAAAMTFKNTDWKRAAALCDIAQDAPIAYPFALSTTEDAFYQTTCNTRKNVENRVRQAKAKDAIILNPLSEVQKTRQPKSKKQDKKNPSRKRKWTGSKKPWKKNKKYIANKNATTNTKFQGAKKAPKRT